MKKRFYIVVLTLIFAITLFGNCSYTKADTTSSQKTEEESNKVSLDPDFKMDEDGSIKLNVDLIGDDITDSGSYNGFYYNVIDNKYINIYACDKNDVSEVNIPSKINGMPVRYLSAAFAFKTNITKVTIPDTVAYIGVCAFSGCTNLQEVSLSKNLVSIDSDAFSDCAALRKIELPEGLLNLGIGVFMGCTSLKEITIPKSVCYVAQECFKKCSSLKDATVLCDLKKIGDSTFESCTSLENVNFKGKLESTGYGMFDECASLKKLVLPDGLKNISGAIIDKNNNFSELYIPNSVENINWMAIYSIESREDPITVYYVEGNNAVTDFMKYYDAKVCHVDVPVKFVALSLSEYDFKIKNASDASVSYRTHVQSFGWQDYVSNGETSGTTGMAKRLEGINIKVSDNNYSGGVSYKTHVQKEGWQDWVSDGAMSGTSGKALRLEAIQVKLTGELAQNYDIYYRVHAQHFGWMGWAKNGESAGTAGYAYRLEAIEIKIVKKDGSAPGTTENCFKQKPISVTYTTHVQKEGWQNYVSDGDMAGTSGKALRLEGLKINLSNKDVDGNIEYSTHVQSIGWQDYVSNGALAGTTGRALRLEAVKIRLTGELANKYDVYYRVHAQKFGWLGWAKNDAPAGTAGYAYRLEALEVKLVEKGAAAPGSTDNAFYDKNKTQDSGNSQDGGNNQGSGDNQSGEVNKDTAMLNKATYDTEKNQIILQFNKAVNIKDGSMIKLYDKGDAYDNDIDYPTNFTFDNKQYVDSITQNGNEVVCQLTEYGPVDHTYASGMITLQRIKHKDNIRIKLSKSTDTKTALTDENGKDLSIKEDVKVPVEIIDNTPINYVWINNYDGGKNADNQIEVGFENPLNLSTIKLDNFRVVKVDESGNPIDGQEVPIKSIGIGWCNQCVLLTLDEDSPNYKSGDRYNIGIRNIEDVYGNTFSAEPSAGNWYFSAWAYFNLSDEKKAEGKEISYAYYEDTDENNEVNEGDKILVEFDDGIIAPDNLTIDNFSLSDDCNLGTGYKIERGEFNNDLIITLGKGAKLNHGTSTINISSDISKVELYGINNEKFVPSQDPIIIK